MFNWYAVGNYTIAMFVTTAIILGVMHFASKGRVWKSFSSDSYKCGMLQMLSSSDVPNLTGIYENQNTASQGALACNSPQAFMYDGKMCTLHNGSYVCN
jgi:hypothetical protein